MSTGFGTNGGRNRCFSFWSDFVRCNANAEPHAVCALMFEDYQECLYHRKEHLRIQLVEKEYKKSLALNKSNAQSAAHAAAPAVAETNAEKAPAAA